jgi:Uma2 family endonuclease
VLFRLKDAFGGFIHLSEWSGRLDQLERSAMQKNAFAYPDMFEERAIEIRRGHECEQTAADALAVRISKLFNQAFADRAVVMPGAPVRLNAWTEPEPDIVVLKPRKDFYLKKRATLDDVLFIVEVAETSLRFDQKVKLPRYVAVIPEIWIVDVQNELIHVNRELAGQAYKTVLRLLPGDSISPLAFPDTNFRVGELLGTDYASQE